MNRAFAFTVCASLGALAAAGVPTKLGWQDEPEETLHFDGAVYGGFSVTGEYEYHAAVRFTPDKPCSVVAVIFYQVDTPADGGLVIIYGEGTNNRPGSRLTHGTYPAAGAQRWKRVELNEPVPVDSGVDFWTCVTTTYNTGDHPLGVDPGPLVRSRGGFIKVPMMGETWYELIDAPFGENRNWNQRAIILPVTGIEEELEPAAPPVAAPRPTIVRGALFLEGGIVRGEGGAWLLDISGRTVMDLASGENDVSRVAPGVYFVRDAAARATRKVIIQR